MDGDSFLSLGGLGEDKGDFSVGQVSVLSTGIGGDAKSTAGGDGIGWFSSIVASDVGDGRGVVSSLGTSAGDVTVAMTGSDASTARTTAGSTSDRDAGDDVTSLEPALSSGRGGKETTTIDDELSPSV